MPRAFIALLISLPALASAALAQAQSAGRAIPDAQDATAELWFLGASVALILALLAVHLLVRRR